MSNRCLQGHAESPDARGTVPRRPPGPSRMGFSLVELMAAIVVVGILAGSGYALLAGSHHDWAAEHAARRLAADIEFAQSDAIAMHATRVVRFDAANDAYRIVSAGADIWHPMTGLWYRVNLGTHAPGALADLHLHQAAFGGADSLVFTAGGLCVSGGKVFIDVGERSWSVTVADQTGHITVRQES